MQSSTVFQKPMRAVFLDWVSFDFFSVTFQVFVFFLKKTLVLESLYRRSEDLWSCQIHVYVLVG